MSPAVAANFIETENPFSLARPPASFLLDLWIYDSKLVIFPSTAEPVYRLCRRVSGNFPWEKFPPGHTDNPICHAHRLIPLKAIQPIGTQWGQVIIAGLAACDTQRAGGGTKFAELLDEQEQLEERRLDARIADEASERAGTAYRAIGYMTGSRVSLSSPTPEGAGYVKNPFAPRAPKKTRRPVHRPRASGDHAIFVGR